MRVRSAEKGCLNVLLWLILLFMEILCNVIVYEITT
jgi:hypothetical protein